MPICTGTIRGAAAVLLVMSSACTDGNGAASQMEDVPFIAGDAAPHLDGSDRTDAGPADATPADAIPSDAPLDAGTATDTGPETLDAGDPCLSAPSATLSATVTATRAEAFIGQVIALTGTATRTALDCTERVCPEDMPCCNDCSARIRVGNFLLAPSSCFTAEPACQGSECSQTCRPPLFGLPQTFRGVLSRGINDLELLLFDIEDE